MRRVIKVAAYVVGFLRVKDWKWYREYRSVAEPLVAKHGGRYLAKGGPLSWLEGDPLPPPDAVVMLEFPTREQAQQFYDDPAYVPMITLRKNSSQTELVIVDSI